jgi:HEPN domain-containing protein
VEASVVLFANGKTIEGLFFCHLAAEKMLKALVVKETAEIPPRTHDLFKLAEIAAVQLSEGHIVLCQVLMRYQLEGRYPVYRPVNPDKKTALAFLSETKTLVEWIKEKL